jgi:O-acetyl-ADP-ribose deacetylase
MRILLVAGDLTVQAVDAIVNAANSTLLGGGGVDGAIHAAAGPKLLEECRRLRKTTHREGLAVGQAVATGGYDLPARWVIHTVGPNWNRGQRDPALLASCFTECLRIAAELGAGSLAFPAISAGAYGWAVDQVAEIAVETVRVAGSTSTDPTSIDEVRFVVRGKAAESAFAAALERE